MVQVTEQRSSRPVAVVTAFGWVTACAVVLALAPATGGLQHEHEGATPIGVLVGANINLIVVGLLIAVVRRITRDRVRPDVAARAPRREVAAREVAGLIAYGVAVQVAGAVLGVITGGHPVSFHLAGTLYGHVHVTPEEAYLWAAYNVVAYALIPYLWFRRRYSAEQL